MDMQWIVIFHNSVYLISSASYIFLYADFSNLKDFLREVIISTSSLKEGGFQASPKTEEDS